MEEAFLQGHEHLTEKEARLLSPLRLAYVGDAVHELFVRTGLIFDGGKAGAIFTSEDIQQRAAMLLKDVHYVFEAHFEMTEQANPSDNHGKFQDIVKRRLRRGACYSTPYFGCRECTAHFRLWEGGEIPAIDETRDLGYMLYDMDYSDPTDIQPMFFRARMEHGVIDLRNCEVVR